MHVDQSQPDYNEQERFAHVAVHDKKKHMQETKATKLPVSRKYAPVFNSNMNVLTEQCYVIKFCTC